MIVLDSGQDPGVGPAVAAAQAAGAQAWEVYVGGWSLYYPPWSTGTCQGLRVAGYGILSVYAYGSPLMFAQGAMDGAEAATLAAAYGCPLGSLIMLDIEGAAETAAGAQYAAGWASGVRGADYRPAAYSNSGFFALLNEGDWDAVIVASYLSVGSSTATPDLGAAPGFGGRWRASRGWQYAENVPIAGVTCDINVINFSLAAAGRLFDRMYFRSQD
jgi:hypothetical protein